MGVNIRAKEVILNDKQKEIVRILEIFKRLSFDALFTQILGLIDEFSLSNSAQFGYGFYKCDSAKGLSSYNKVGFLCLKNAYNADKDALKLFVLIIYAFNNQIRFNSKGKFNLPMSNVDFNANVFNALNGYFSSCKNKEMKLFNADYVEFLSKFEFKKDDFIYFDPPYLISDSKYNKLWSDDKEREFYAFLYELNAKGVRFGLTNLLTHKGRHNALLENFARKYHCKDIVSNYISFNDNSIKKDSKELYVMKISLKNK